MALLTVGPCVTDSGKVYPNLHVDMEDQMLHDATVAATFWGHQGYVAWGPRTPQAQRAVTKLLDGNGTSEGKAGQPAREQNPHNRPPPSTDSRVIIRPQGIDPNVRLGTPPTQVPTLPAGQPHSPSGISSPWNTSPRGNGSGTFRTTGGSKQQRGVLTAAIDDAARSSAQHVQGGRHGRANRARGLSKKVNLLPTTISDWDILLEQNRTRMMDSIEDVTKLVGLPYLGAKTQVSTTKSNTKAKSDPRKRTQQKGGDQTKQNASLHHTNVAKTSLMTGSSKVARGKSGRQQPMDYENVGPDVDEVLAPLGPWMGVQALGTLPPPQAWQPSPGLLTSQEAFDQGRYRGGAAQGPVQWGEEYLLNANVKSGTKTARKSREDMQAGRPHSSEGTMMRSESGRARQAQLQALQQQNQAVLEAQQGMLGSGKAARANPYQKFYQPAADGAAEEERVNSTEQRQLTQQEQHQQRLIEEKQRMQQMLGQQQQHAQQLQLEKQLEQQQQLELEQQQQRQLQELQHSIDSGRGSEKLGRLVEEEASFSEQATEAEADVGDAGLVAEVSFTAGLQGGVMHEGSAERVSETHAAEAGDDEGVSLSVAQQSVEARERSGKSERSRDSKVDLEGGDQAWSQGGEEEDVSAWGGEGSEDRDAGLEMEGQQQQGSGSEEASKEELDAAEQAARAAKAKGPYPHYYSEEQVRQLELEEQRWQQHLAEAEQQGRRHHQPISEQQRQQLQDRLIEAGLSLPRGSRVVGVQTRGVIKDAGDLSTAPTTRAGSDAGDHDAQGAMDDVEEVLLVLEEGVGSTDGGEQWEGQVHAKRTRVMAIPPKHPVLTSGIQYTVVKAVGVPLLSRAELEEEERLTQLESVQAELGAPRMARRQREGQRAGKALRRMSGSMDPPPQPTAGVSMVKVVQGKRHASPGPRDEPAPSSSTVPVPPMPIPTMKQATKPGTNPAPKVPKTLPPIDKPQGSNASTLGVAQTDVGRAKMQDVWTK